MLECILITLGSLAGASAGDEPITTTVLVRGTPYGEFLQGAELRWVPLGPLDPGFDPYEVLQRERLFHDGPVLARTDEDGRAQLTHPAGKGLVCVSIGEQRGCECVALNSPQALEIPVYRDWAAEVEVVDPAGEALTGLGLCLRYSTDRDPEYVDALQTRVPIENGRARFEHVGFFQAAHGRERRYAIGLTGWIGAPVVVWIPSGRPSKDLARLSLPAHGQLELSVLDEDHKPTRALDPLWIGDPDVLPRVVGWPAALPAGLLAGGSGFVVVPIGSGTLTLAHVACGSPLRACVQRNGTSATSTLELRGPARSGELARAELVLGSGCVTLRGRAKLPAGFNLGYVDLWDRSLVPLGRAILRQPLTESGEFVLDLGFAIPAGGRYELVLRAARFAPRATEWIWSYLPLNDRWTSGVHDFGEILLESDPLLAAGCVLDARSGAPIAGVCVSADPDTRATSDAHGRFELRGGEDRLLFELEFLPPAGGGVLSTVQHKVARGTRDLRVELQGP